MAGQKKNQLTRYGAISRDYPFGFGPVFILVNTTSKYVGDLMARYPQDEDGLVRVFTTWAAVITAFSNYTNLQGITVVVDANYQVAPTSSQFASLEAAGVSIIYSGFGLDTTGMNITYAPAAALPADTTATIFTVTGKCLVTSIVGEVTTGIQNQACNLKISNLVTTPSGTVDLCANGAIANAAVGTQLVLPAAFATALAVDTAGAAVLPIVQDIVLAGTIILTTSATNTGAVKWLIRWIPLEPGAMIHV